MTRSINRTQAAEGYVSLREAMAQIGPKLVFGWRGNELTHDIWQEPGDGAAQYKYTRLAVWLQNSAKQGEIRLFYFDASKNLTSIDMSLVVRRDGLYFTGHLTDLTPEEIMSGRNVDPLSPELFVHEETLEARVADYLAPDPENRWSIYQAVAWVATRRYEIVRESTGFFGWIFRDLEQYYADDVLVGGREALRVIWDALKDGKLDPLGLPKSDQLPRAIPSHEWHYLELDSHGSEERLTIEGVGTLYSRPTLNSTAIMEIWGPPSVEGTSEPGNENDLRSQAHNKMRPSDSEVEADYVSYKAELGRDPTRDEVRLWGARRPYDLKQDDGEALRKRHLDQPLKAGRKGHGKSAN